MLLCVASGETTVLVTKSCVSIISIFSTAEAPQQLAPHQPALSSSSVSSRLLILRPSGLHTCSLIAEVADDEFGYVQLTYDLQSFGAQLPPERQPAELLQTHGSGYGESTHAVRSQQ